MSENNRYMGKELLVVTGDFGPPRVNVCSQRQSYKVVKLSIKFRVRCGC